MSSPVPRSRIVGTGHFLPPIIRTNDDISKLVDTNDAWITERTGIRKRHIAPDDMVTSDMATEAGRRAIEAAGLTPADIDMIIVGTVTPDMPMPATAVFVQQKLGCGPCPAFDLSAACAGFVYGLTLADSLVARGGFKHILVIGVELLSRVTDWTDRTTCVLFGDGAGAVVVGPIDPAEPTRGILSTNLHTDSSLSRSLMIPGGGTADPQSIAVLERGDNKIKMRGQDIFRVAVKNLYSASMEAIVDGGSSVEALDWVVSHQANLRIIDQVISRAGFPQAKALTNIARVGNTSSASIPILLDENVRAGVIKPGHVTLFCALGAGVSWGAALVRM